MEKRIYSAEVKNAVANQIINMLVNDILHNNGIENFLGWCADGEVYEDNGVDVDECMALSEEITEYVDKISLMLNHSNF